jgi:dihydroorotase
VALVDYIQRRARDNALVRVHVMAAMTKGLKGEEMTEIGLLQRAGAIAFTNGKASVANTRIMRNVLLSTPRTSAPSSCTTRRTRT